MPAVKVLQHLLEEVDHFRRGYLFVVQAKQQVFATSTMNAAPPLASRLFWRRLLELLNTIIDSIKNPGKAKKIGPSLARLPNTGWILRIIST